MLQCPASLAAHVTAIEEKTEIDDDDDERCYYFHDEYFLFLLSQKESS
jgi:hypothetical protein